MSAAGEVTDIGVVQNDDDGPRPNQQIIDVILPTYIMKPEETELFYPSVVKKIADEVLLKFLDKQDFDEDESKTWILKISEEIKARVKSVYLPPVGYMLPTHCPPPLPPSLLAHSLPSAPSSAQASATSRVIRWWCR